MGRRWPAISHRQQLGVVADRRPCGGQRSCSCQSCRAESTTKDLLKNNFPFSMWSRVVWRGLRPLQASPSSKLLFDETLVSWPLHIFQWGSEGGEAAPQTPTLMCFMNKLTSPERI